MSTAPRTLLALMAAMDLPVAADVPDWVHLLPLGQANTFDGRGPYRLVNAAAVIAASMSDPRGMLIDVNHATDIAAPKGGDAPARGWIKALESRDDGIWAQVDWTAEGRALLADRSYRGLSPVIQYLEDGTVLRILRASLTNLPNIRKLTALNMESQVTPSTFLARLAEKLGLPATATEDELIAAIPSRSDTAMQAAMAEIGTALGVDGTNTAAIIAAVQGKKAEGGALTSLQAENTTLKTRLDTLEKAQKRGASEAFIDSKIAEKRAGLNASTRETYVALHMQQPTVAETLIAGMPVLGPSAAGATPPDGGAVLTSLNAEQRQVADAMGIKPEIYLATLTAERANKEA